MQVVKINPFSVCSHPLTMICSNQTMGTATAFFWRQNSKTYLISNWHVLSGREPTSGQPIDKKYCAVPDAIKINGIVKSDYSQRFEMTLQLNDQIGKPLWWQHKTYGQKVDIAVFDLDQVLEGKYVAQMVTCLNEVSQEEEMVPQVGRDTFILGFPLGIMKTDVLPVWKRASIATEPEFPVNDLPSFLVDTATREGMSGSPVIFRESSYRTRSGQWRTTGQLSTKFLGVYSGRYIGELGEAQLGIVWKKELIGEILHDPSQGDFELK